MSDSQAPSLFGSAAPPRRPAAFDGGHARQVGAPRAARSLLDLLYDGFYMICLLRNQYVPADAEGFRDSIKQFLAGFEVEAKRIGADADDIHLAKFAYCAVIDEVVLMSKLPLRVVWERRPLQLEFFGEHLAGERFFEHLESLRRAGAPRLQTLEVFHMCLLLGFQGRYIVDGSEKLNYLTGRLGDEIAHLRGSRAAFAPHWAAPDRTVHALKRDVPLWVIGSLFAVTALGAYSGLQWALDGETQAALAPYTKIVNLAPLPANITITLP